MATVPRVTGPSVQANVTPEVTASPDQFGAIQARQLSALGGATGVAADALTAVQEREDATAVLNAEAKIKDEAAKRQVQYQQMQGVNALGLTKSAQKAWDDSYKEVELGLANSRQRAMLKQRTAGVETAHIESVSTHEAQQSKIAADNSAQASLKTSVDFAAANASNPDAINQARHDIANLSAFISHSRGDTTDTASAVLQHNLSTMHLGVIQNLADTDPTGAKIYFNHFKSEIEGTAYDNVDKLLNSASRRAVAQHAGDEAISKFSTAKDALAWVRSTYKDPEDRAAVEQEVKARYDEQIMLRKQDEQNAFDKAYKMIEHGARYSQIPPSLLARMSGEGIAALRQKTDEPDGPSGTSWNRYYELRNLALSQPDKFAKLDLRLETQLRPEDREKLATLQLTTAGKTPDYLEATTTEQLLGAAYNSMGMYDSDKSEHTAKLKGAFANEVYRRIDAEQASLKRKLTSKEKQDVIDETAVQGTLYRGWGPFHWNKNDAYSFELTPEQLKNFTPTQIPPRLRSLITTAIQRSRGNTDPVSETDLMTAYRTLATREQQRLNITHAK